MKFKNEDLRTIMSKSNQNIIKESHRLSGETKQLAQFYRKWADTYNDDVLSEQYSAPEYIADYFSRIQKENNQWDKTIKILDAGCGSGLVGTALHQKGYQYIDGCDLSSEMISLAKQQKVYQELYGGVDLNNMASFEDGQYDAVISCGVFTIGHVPPTALKELVRITRKGGMVVVSTRMSYYESTDFQSVCDSLEEKGRFSIVNHIIDAYISEENAHYWAFNIH